MMKKIPIFIVFLLFLLVFYVPARADGLAVQALADKSDQVVVFFDARGQEIARFSAVFGQVQGPKTREGDRRTPEGDYMLTPARSSDDWDWFMPIDYPNAADRARARAEGRPAKTLGNHIGMHSVGNGFLHSIRQSFGENWTFGCIAVRDSAMREIRQLVTNKIPIRIQP